MVNKKSSFFKDLVDSQFYLQKYLVEIQEYSTRYPLLFLDKQ